MTAKKTETKAETKAPDESGAVILEAPASPPVDPAIVLPYTVGSWCGRPNYECRMCPYSTLSKQAIVDHVAAHFRKPDPDAAPAETHS